MDQTDTENAQDNSQEGTTSNTGPDPMPQLEGDSSSGGTA
jgi:hypothetical protein